MTFRASRKGLGLVAVASLIVACSVPGGAGLSTEATTSSRASESPAEPEQTESASTLSAELLLSASDLPAGWEQQPSQDTGMDDVAQACSLAADAFPTPDSMVTFAGGPDDSQVVAVGISPGQTRTLDDMRAAVACSPFEIDSDDDTEIAYRITETPIGADAQLTYGMTATIDVAVPVIDRDLRIAYDYALIRTPDTELLLATGGVDPGTSGPHPPTMQELVDLVLGRLNGTVPFADPQAQPSPSACTAQQVTVDASHLYQVEGYEDITGPVTITITDVVEAGRTIDDATADGRFVAVVYTVDNDATMAVQPVIHIARDLRIANEDGQTWELPTFDARSVAWAKAEGLHPPDQFIDPGTVATTAAVFDIPADAAPNHVLLGVRDGTDRCVDLPQASPQPDS